MAVISNNKLVCGTKHGTNYHVLEIVDISRDTTFINRVLNILPMSIVS